jgi:hypothetical protein
MSYVAPVHIRPDPPYKWLVKPHYRLRVMIYETPVSDPPHLAWRVDRPATGWSTGLYRSPATAIQYVTDHLRYCGDTNQRVLRR